jgi:hypothetical protein
MALDFNNQAVAENYSLREAMRAMLKPEFNFIDAMYSNPKNATQRRQWFRHTVINIVLATDMSRHYELLSQFNIQIVNNPAFKFLATREKWLKMSDAQRLLSLQIALKVADLGHCALPMDQHREWISLLETEFFAQVGIVRHSIPFSGKMNCFIMKGRNLAPIMLIAIDSNLNCVDCFLYIVPLVVLN